MTDVAPQPASLLDWATGLATDPAARAGFAADPRGTLDRQGLTDLDPADLHHAMPLVADTVAARVDAVVESPSTAPVLDGESRVDALVRQFTSLSEAVTPPDVALHDPAEDTGLDDVAALRPVPGDHDLDDHPVDHGLDEMGRPDDHGHGPPAATVSFLPSAGRPEAPHPGPDAPPGHEDPGAEHEDPGPDLDDHGPDEHDPGHHDPGHHEHQDLPHHDVEQHEVEHHHDLGVHDLGAAP